MVGTSDWNVTLVQWRGVSLCIHPTMILLAVIAMLWSGSASVRLAANGMTLITLATLLLLLLSVFMHQLGHFIAARRLGVRLKRIVLSPVGDLSDDLAFSSPLGTCLWAVAGPIANLLVCALCLIGLLGVDPMLDGSRLFNPLQPAWEIQSYLTIGQVLKIAFWLNYVLLLVNCVPAFPFDAAFALRGLFRAARPAMRRSRITNTMFVVGVVASIALFVAAALAGRSESDALVPAWWAMILLAVTALVGTLREARRGELNSGAADDRRRLASVVATQESLAMVRAVECQLVEPSGLDWDVVDENPVSDQQDQQTDEQLLDEVLRRVHANGMACLTSAERALLERVSERYRRRLHRDDISG